MSVPSTQPHGSIVTNIIKHVNGIFPSEQPHRSTLSKEELFTLLSNARRRIIIRQLRSSPEGIDMDDLAREVAAVEEDLAVNELSNTQYKRHYVSCYQTHVPKLCEAEVVAYDEDDRVVRPGENLTPLAAVLEKVDTLYP